MSKRTEIFYRRCPEYPHPDFYCKVCRNENYVPGGVTVEPDAIKVHLQRSMPNDAGTYTITVTADQPANSLTMHGELWLVPGPG